KGASLPIGCPAGTTSRSVPFRTSYTCPETIASRDLADRADPVDVVPDALIQVAEREEIKVGHVLAAPLPDDLRHPVVAELRHATVRVVDHEELSGPEQPARDHQ